MTAAEIRETKERAVKNLAGLRDLATEDQNCFLFGVLVGTVIELTAQVAELKETLRGK